ncbi:DJ-1/PfpI family protein [Mycoplasmopsis cynos]|uniref:DJ-1/PfpI family protein n=1 Tax=Mycoplasmopsis cynos TaxID=171284 RepID=UPI002967C0D5|nr:DJ-1/PfpI family protein [Mycoplasmopsis cynos]MCU9936789.1 DJ-1/PfpI family protein [Mycoplasmopsis cynos]WQQ18639.1 DJ-1/PfpI family protein [Mycoplasmopsis cynos]
MNLLVIVEDNFKDVELVTPLTIFQTSQKFNKIDFYNPSLKIAKGVNGLAKIENIHNEININDYDMVFIPGGPGSQDLRKNLKSINIIKQLYEKMNKKLVAICDAPNVLSEHKIIQNEKFSSYPTDWSSEYRTSNWTTELISKSNNKLYTGNSPYSSAKLAFMVIIEVFGYDVALKTYQIFAGSPDAKEIVL